MWWRSVYFFAGFFGILIYLIPNIIWLICWPIGKLLSTHIPYAPFAYTGLALVLMLWALLAYGGYIGRFQSVVNHVVYESEKVPAAFDGLRIVHISDLHVDSFDDHPDSLQKTIDLVNAQEPDIILFTGDITTASVASIRTHEAALKSLKARYGVVSVLGNHDFFIYDLNLRTDAERCAAADRLAAYERDTLGWTVLRNEHILLGRGGETIAIAGVDNINGNQGFKTIQRGDLSKAMEGTDGVFTILLTHDPSHWQAEVLKKSHAEITLSGHTHAAQVRLFGWSLANLMFRECDGRYDEGDRMLYVNAGIGCTAPFRINCPQEITVIELRHKD